MRTLLVLAVLLLVFTDSRAESADAPKRTMPHQEKCAVPLPTDFWDDLGDERSHIRESEQWAWNKRICLGVWADMRYAPGGRGKGEVCAPAKSEEAEESTLAHRELRPEFLELVLSHEPWISVPRRPSVGIKCALVRGKIRLSEHEIVPAFYLHESKIQGEVTLVGTKFKRSFGLDGSTVTGKLDADRMEVGRYLFLRNGSFADIDLLTVEIVGNADFDGATVTGKLDADRMEVGHSLFLRNGSFADIDLLTVEIVGNADFNGATITGKLDADSMEVGRNLVLLSGSFARIDLLTGKIGGNIQLSGSTFAGELDLTGAAIGGEIHLASGKREKSPIWQDGATLILRNVRANALQARQEDWSISGGDGLLPTELTGFTYSRLEGLDTSGGKGMGDETADWLIGWIEAQRDHGTNFDPQPYTQLAGILEATGATDKAKAIRYAKFEHKQDHDKSMNLFRRAFLLIEQIFVGFGVYPLLALAWFAGLVVFGGVVAQWSNDQSVRRWSGLWYSLENALPLIETNERFKEVVHDRPCLVHFFHFQKAFGFFLATILVGALTLLSG